MARRALIGLALLLAVALGASIYRFNVSRGAGDGLAGEAQQSFARSVAESCVARQKAAPENASVKPETIASYCGCYGNELSKRVTAIELARLGGQSPSEMQSAMGPKMAESEDACFEKLDEKT